MPAEPNPGRLHLRIFARPPHPELLPDTRHSCVRVGRGQADVYVGPFGHAVSMTADGATLCEVVGFEDADFRGAAVCRSVRRAGNVDWATPGVRYAASCSVDEVDPEVFERLDQEVRCDAREATVAVTSGGGNRLQTAPVSIVTAKPVDGGLSVHAVHTFPSANSVLRTQSLFEVHSTA